TPPATSASATSTNKSGLSARITATMQRSKTRSSGSIFTSIQFAYPIFATSNFVLSTQYSVLYHSCPRLRLPTIGHSKQRIYLLSWLQYTHALLAPHAADRLGAGADGNRFDGVGMFVDCA